VIEEGLDLLVVLGGLFDDGFEGAGKGGDSYLGYALATALRQTSERVTGGSWGQKGGGMNRVLVGVIHYDLRRGAQGRS